MTLMKTRSEIEINRNRSSRVCLYTRLFSLIESIFFEIVITENPNLQAQETIVCAMYQWVCLHFVVCMISLTSSILHQTRVAGRLVNKTPLSTTDDLSPFTYSLASITDLDSSKDNFLATQVWPSARVASNALLELVDANWKVCEFGCGPGLPSIAAARKGCPLVVATDVDNFALELVQAASKEQDLDQQLVTHQIDLTQNASCVISNAPWFQEIDLFLMADIFENAQVARGAADLTKEILKLNHGPKVWVFAQADRAQREDYLESIREIFPKAKWRGLGEHDPTNNLWLVDLDETKVKYS